MYSRSPTTQWKKDAGNQTDDTDSEPQMSYEGRINSLSLKDNPLSLMPQFASEACAASKTARVVNTTSSKVSNAGGSTSTTLSLEFFQNEIQRSGSEDEKSTKDAVTRGMDDKPVSHVGDVPEELQLEFGDKKMCASAVASETNHDHSASSKCEFV
ncbi:unnamed protein product [Brassica oleracea]|uniref:Uncharacterized protein n=2 Tax=Brassica oleracea TaxID=3712 RepID=A0A0D3B3S2_BRAOL|nr:unnamed protein product [Brassica oleracea]